MSSSERQPPRQTQPPTYPCPKCGAVMHIFSAEQERPGYEKQVFGCSVCMEAKTVIAKIRREDGV
jgi:hypothetical protein